GMHHAGIDYGGGFCIFNDVAVCAKMLLEDYGFKRILILDTDAHAGDGTMDIFYEDPSVLFISVHQDPRTLYPGKGFIWEVGAEEGKGFTICVPLPPRSGDDVYKLVLEEIFMPVAREFKPDVIIRNGGSDPHWGDALTNLGLSLSGFKMIGEYVKRAADEVCSGRLVDLIGSGYNPVVLPKAWTAIILGIAGVNMELKEVFKPPSWLNSPEILEAAKKIIDEVKVVHSEYWDCFK
nr:histone deacetylase [Candidatus Bathyarchaeota archaeon]